ncbi:MAG: DUF1080 domain-containing protein [Dysgonamonadaceae bacterium]|nr:DUF1080 domain-containing protein [Dysgonamonadaceae bacterium]
MMKSIRLSIIAVIATIATAACVQSPQHIPDIVQAHKDRASFTKLNDGTAQLLPLFNGQDLTGWYTYTKAHGKNNDLDGSFAVADGILHFDGENMGYLCTNDTYRNYYLRVVFRWGDKKYPPREDDPRDSGVLYHFPDTAADDLWPLSIECQVQENDCGDYYAVGGSTLESPNADAEGKAYRVVRTANFENPLPEWNTIEIICLDDKSEHYVNGQKVNEAYNLSVSEGKILLQLEAAEIFYKSIELLPLR